MTHETNHPDAARPPSTIDFPQLARLLAAHRGSQSLRDLAAEIGDVSMSTLARVEGERLTDITMSTFLRLCDWLGVPPTRLIRHARTGTPPSLDSLDWLALQIRHDPALDPRAARILAAMITAGYQALQRESTRSTTDD